MIIWGDPGYCIASRVHYSNGLSVLQRPKPA